MHQHVIEWEGRTIAWSRSGSGPPVVLVHGTPFSARVWAAHAAELAAHYTVHTWDLPGYGESSKEPGHTVDLGVHARALAALVEHWGLRAPHVVAHDIGGGVAVRAHLVEQVPLASLLLADAVVVPPTGSDLFAFIGAHPGLMDDLPPHIHEAVVRAYVAGATHVGLDPVRLDELVEPWTGAVGQSAFYRQIADFDQAYLAENERLIGGVDLPVRVLWGAEDAWMPVERGRRLHGLLPGASWRLIPGAGHLVPYDAPVAVAWELSTWLAARTAQA